VDGPERERMWGWRGAGSSFATASMGMH
jgi:hypothetical protein